MTRNGTNRKSHNSSVCSRGPARNPGNAFSTRLPQVCINTSPSFSSTVSSDSKPSGKSVESLALSPDRKRTVAPHSSCGSVLVPVCDRVTRHGQGRRQEVPTPLPKVSAAVGSLLCMCACLVSALHRHGLLHVLQLHGTSGQHCHSNSNLCANIEVSNAKGIYVSSP